MKKVAVGIVAVLSLVFLQPVHAEPSKSIVIIDTAIDSSIPQVKAKLVQEVCILDRMLCPNGTKFQEGVGAATLPSSQALVNGFEHGTYMSEETMDLMKKYDAYLVPTLTAGKEVEKNAEINGFYPEIVVPKAREIGPKIQATFSKAYKKGVKIAFGTDASVFPHGNNAKEFSYMINGGMSPIEAIQSATITNAFLLGIDNEVGQIKEGFLADIIAVNENPLLKINTLENVPFVMKDGVIYKN